MGRGLTSVVQNYFDKEVQTDIISNPNADLIAVSLACPTDPKSPYRMGPPVSSVRNLEKVGDLETLQFWSNQTLAFLTFTDLH